jgi:fibronectin-binding autotransporter adhesin
MKAKTITSTITSICLVASIQPMLAASQTWNGSTTGGGTGVSDTWDTTSANWVSPTTWPSSGTDNDALFDGTAGTVTISGGVTANDITFGVTGYTVTGSTLTLNGGATPVVSVTTGTAAIGSQIQGTAGLTKSGAGTLELSAANTFSGIVTVNQGTLILKNTNANNGLAVQNASSILIDGGTMSLQGTQNALTSSGKAVTIQNGGVLSVNAAGAQTLLAVTLNGGTMSSVTGSFLPGGDFTVGGSALSTISAGLYTTAVRTFNVADAVAGASTDLLVSGAITNTGGIIKSGVGTMELSGANSFSGTVTVNQGTLILSNTNANNGQAVAGASSILIDGGTMSLQGGIQNALTASGKAVTVQNGGTLSADAGTNLTHTVQTITLNGGNLAATNGGSFYMAPGAGVTVGGSTLSTVSAALFLNGNRTFTVADAVTGSGTDLLVSGAISGNAGNSITKSGVGTMALSGTNSFSGTVTVNQGTLILSNTSGLAVQSASSILIDGGTMSLQGGVQNALTSGGKAVTIQNGGTLSADAGTNFAHNIQAITLNGGNLAATNGGEFYMNAGVTVGGSILSTVSAKLELNGASRTFLVNEAVAGTDLLVSGVISGNSVGFTKTGNGTMELRATNSFNGAINVSAGTLVLNDTVGGNPNVGSTVNNVSSITVDGTLSLQGTQNALGVNGRALTIQNGGTVSADRIGGGAHTLAAVTMNGGNLVAGVSGGSYQLGGNVTVGGSALSTISAPMTLLSGVRTFDVADAVTGSATDLLVSGAVSNGSVTKTGVGTMQLTGTHTYAGATTVSAGTLRVNGNISTSSLTTVNSGATLGGSGTVGALTIDSGGFFSPGNSPGITTVNGNYIQNGSLIAEVTGLTPGITGHDQVVVNGTVTLNGALSLTMSTFTPMNGDLLFILLNDSTDAISGTFTGLAQDAVAYTYGGFDWKISYTANNTGVGTGTFTGGNDIALMAIPEPNVAALIGGLGLFALLRRRR